MKIIGHRGARGLAPENTIAALKKALEHHVDAIEFDLRVTKDNIVILHHDRHVRDANGKKLLISATGFSILKKHKPDLATFDEVLTKIGNLIILYPEIKPNEPTEQIVKSIQARLDEGWNPESFRIASYSLPILLELKVALPGIQKTVLERWSGVRATRKARKIGSQHIIMNHHWMWWGFIRAMSKRGYRVGAYTLNSTKKAKRWEKYGLRAVVTDYPDLFEDF